MKNYNVCALGEILIDFTTIGKSENGMNVFEQNPGGAPANVLAAISSLGGNAAFLGKIGKDMHGDFLRETLMEHSINTDGLISDENYFTTLAFVSLKDGERSFSFARKPGADTQLAPDEVNTDIIRNSDVLHIGSLSLTDEPAKSATLYAIDTARKENITVSYDPNYRAMLWGDEERAKKGMQEILDKVDIIKISDEETNLLTPYSSPEDAAKHLLTKGISTVIVTLGKEGALIVTKDGMIKSLPAPCEKVVDTTGAGDSFMGGFLFKMTKDGLTPKDITLEKAKEYADFANKVAAYCIQRRGAINAMPSYEDVAE